MDTFIKTLICIASLIIFYLLIKYGFKLIFKFKTTVAIKFFKSVIIIAGFAIIIGIYLHSFSQFQDVNKILLQSSTLIVAIATFSCQAILGNILSGVLINSTKLFKIGDKILIKDNSGSIVEGKVIDMNIRHVTLQLANGQCAMITNSLIDNKIIINENKTATIGHEFIMECSLTSDVNLAIELMQQTIDKHNLTLDTDAPQHKVTCSGISNQGFLLKTIILTENLQNNFIACSDLRIEIYNIWKENGITVPYNTITIN